jgi:hypothetical protein
MKPVRTDDAKTALRQLLDDDARAAAGGNALISRAEGRQLDPANRAAELALRAEGGPGTRVSASQVAARAFTDTAAVWDAVNVRGPQTLSKAEVAAVGARAPAARGVTQAAYLEARGAGQDPAAAVRTFFETFDFNDMSQLPGGRRVDVRVGQPARDGVPASILTAFDHYYRAEARDIASVGLWEARVAGQPVRVLRMQTDWDAGHLEVFKPDGTPLTSARLFEGQLFAHDEFFGRTRLSAQLIWAFDETRMEQGLSEAPERAAAGQVPLDWPGDAVIDTGFVHHQDGRLATLELQRGLNLTAEQREVTYMAADILWDMTFRHRADGAAPLELGPNTQGTLRVGEFTRPDDGKTYLVADWRDIDDDSRVLYFERTAAGLRLAISQFDN